MAAEPLRWHFAIKARDFLHAGEASLKVQRLLKEIGFQHDFVRRVSICAYEAEMNVVLHGGDGEMTLIVSPEKILLEVDDQGPGIPDINLALQEGYSTVGPEYREMGFGAGMGLPNIVKHADQFEIHSEPGEGTHLRIAFRVPLRLAWLTL